MKDQLLQQIQALQEQADKLKPALQLQEKSESLTNLQKQMQEPNFWDEPEKAQSISQKAAHLEKILQDWKHGEKDLQEFPQLLDMAEETDLAELSTSLQKLEQKICSIEKQTLLSRPYDERSAILSLHVGNGGQDAEDFCQMLERMYLRYSERQSFKTHILDESHSDVGLKSATLEIIGPSAYGLLKSEHGVHRLIRLSPFNAKNLRQTSFARVEVLPQIEHDTDVVLEEKDIRIDVFRASGHGGQSVNTTDSAVRITYLPLNLVVTCQNEKSQLQNKASALKVLKSRLLQLQLEQHAEKIDQLRGDIMENSFGSQIRTYTLQPYKLVKDHRTDYEHTNPDEVFDGDIDDFIDAFLRQ